MTNSTPIRILCIDDHPTDEEGIATIIRNEPDMLLVAEGIKWARGHTELS